MKNKKRIRIIVADDHEIFRDGFRELVGKCGDVELVAEAGNGEELIQLARRTMPDIIFTDIKMPVMDGIDATKIISAEMPAIEIIALSMANDEHFVAAMLDAGASGYILKNAHKREVIAAIESVYEGKDYYCNSTNLKLAKLIAHKRSDSVRRGRLSIFSEKEKEIIKYICEEKSNKEISIIMCLSVRTIESYREQILEKTNARNTAGIVVYAVRNNLYDV